MLSSISPTQAVGFAFNRISMMKLLSAALAVAVWCAQGPAGCLQRGIGYRSVCRNKHFCDAGRLENVYSVDACVDSCRRSRKCQYVTWDPARRRCGLFGSPVQAVPDHRYISVDMRCAHPGVLDQ
ncbi:MAG: hypothetical protein KVP17_002387 [Porospora cf. gigantea B]|uniref:uncharacterized protein n=1 Tax=Porospora cf. gigantea B TaxID=2853592 RepID=UPI003571F2E0|nr:MAG: hypothetical protein KVP17_002387 [Porospora cf. gigantea B]